MTHTSNVHNTHAYVCMYTYMYSMYFCVCACTYVQYACMYSYTYVRMLCGFTTPTYNLHSVLKAHNMSHTYVHMYVHTYVRKCVHNIILVLHVHTVLTYICTYVCLCAYVGTTQAYAHAHSQPTYIRKGKELTLVSLNVQWLGYGWHQCSVCLLPHHPYSLQTLMSTSKRTWPL